MQYSSLSLCTGHSKQEQGNKVCLLVEESGPYQLQPPFLHSAFKEAKPLDVTYCSGVEKLDKEEKEVRCTYQPPFLSHTLAQD